MMKRIIVVLVTIFCFSGCTEKNFIDTGNASGIFEGNMMEYMKAHPLDWDLTVEVIEYTGLTALFEGKDPEYPEITFFGPTKFSILRYMIEKGYEKVTDRPVDEWKTFLLHHVVKGTHMRDDITRGTSRTGGDKLSAIDGIAVRLYTQAATYASKPDAGAVSIYIEYPRNAPFKVASGDIKPDNGVVHSLAYTYTFGQY